MAIGSGINLNVSGILLLFDMRTSTGKKENVVTTELMCQNGTGLSTWRRAFLGLSTTLDYFGDSVQYLRLTRRMARRDTFRANIKSDTGVRDVVKIQNRGRNQPKYFLHLNVHCLNLLGPVIQQTTAVDDTAVDWATVQI